MKIKETWPFTIVIIVATVVSLSCSRNPSGRMKGPLRVSEINPRYFTDKTGRAIYLTGSHTWNNLVDMGPDQPPEEFDFSAYIDWMRGYPHNFMRLWTWELLTWNTGANREEEPKIHHVFPLPWLRTGPGLALDGNPKFDLATPNPEYFRRLKNHIKLAEENGIYVSVMLFEGWGLQFADHAFENHPFHPNNNINGINGDLDGDGSGVEIHSLSDPRITAFQEMYVRWVVESVNMYDNVLFEISNENHPPSTQWQYHMINYIKNLEKSLPKQHPVGMTFQYRGGSNQVLFESPADWVSPNPEGGYYDDPPPGDGSKVVITDTDHLWGIGGNYRWVWKSFLRGLNPIFMDPYDCKVLKKTYDPEWAEPLRKSMGYTLLLAERIDLIHMIPEPELASSGYCLANRGKEYLVYSPDKREWTLDLEGFPGPFETEWTDPRSGETSKGESVKGDGTVTFVSPFEQPEAVLYLKKN